MKKLICFNLIMAMLVSFIPSYAEDTNDEYISATTESDAYYAQTINEYKGKVVEDPQNVPDGELFGTWDVQNEEWAVESLLNYEKYPELAKVEDAAKRGNFDDAKKELLEYYRRKFATFDEGLAYTSGSRYETARLLVENMYGGTSMGIIAVEEEDSEKSVDIKSYISSATDILTIQLIAVKKDGYKAVLSSREGENTPYIRIEVNGRERFFYPTMDATVSPMNDGKNSYGSETTLEVEESYTSINSNKDRVDEYTKRGYIKFDLSDINEGDIIQSAKLYVTGHMERSENPEESPYKRNIKDIAVFQGGYIEWDENITWRNMINDIIDLDIRSFDGERMISTATLTEARHLSALAFAYNGTENEAFAYHHIRQLVERANIKSGLPSADTNSTLANGMALRDMIPHLFILTKSEYMTPEYFTMLLKYFYMMSQWAVDNWNGQAELNNFGTAAAVGLLTSAVAFKEFRVVDEPLRDEGYENGKSGGWAAVAKHRMNYVARKDMFADGACVEVSFNYTGFILNILGQGINNLKSMNVDFSEYLGEEIYNNIEPYLRYVVQATNPRFGSWHQGHEGDYKGSPIKSYYGTFSDKIDDPLYKWAYSDRKFGEEPKKFKSIAYDVAKKTVMRSGWDSDAVAAQINADGGKLLSHGQNDDLGLNVYAYGEFLLPQSTHKDYNYRTTVTGWLLSSKKVNSIEINNVTQKGAYGVDEEAFGERILTEAGGVPGDMHPENREFNDIYNFTRTETFNYCDHQYLKDDFKLYRDVLFVEPEYFIVTDYVEPKNDKTRNNIYKQYWHMLPDANISLDEESGNVRTNFTDGPNIIVAPVNQKVALKSNIKTGYWAIGSNFTTAKYARYDKETTGSTTFNTVLYPMRMGEDYDIKTENIKLNVDEDIANAFTLEKKNKKSGAIAKASYYTLINEEFKKQRSFGDYQTDAVLAFVQKNEADKNETAVLRKGKELFDSANNKYIIKSNSEISDIGIKWQGDELLVETSKGTLNKEDSEAVKALNLAKGKQVFGSVGSNDVSFAVDGDKETAWNANYKNVNPTPDTFTNMYVDLEEETEVATIVITDIKDKDASYEDKVARGEVVPENRELVAEDKINNYYILCSDDALRWDFIGKTTYTLLEDGKYENKLDFPGSRKARYFKALSTRGDDASICEFEIFGANDRVVILDDITIGAERKISKLIVNGEEVSFKQNPVNLYVYTSDAPIIPDDEITDDPEEEEEKGSSGSGSSGSGSSHGSSGGSSGGAGSSVVVVPPTIPAVDDEKEAYFDKYPEIKGHWGENEIISLLEKDIVKGDTELGLNLKGSVTRAEFAALLVRALELPVSEYKETFKDVKESDWYAKDIIAANEAGLIAGYDGFANPKDNITREQMAKMITDAYKLKNPDVSFDDIEEAVWQDDGEISDWARTYVNIANALGIIKGVEDGVFAPKNAVLREQAFAVIGRLLSDSISE